MRSRVIGSIVFGVVVSSGIAVAGSKVPLRVVRVMPETHQALLYDKVAGTHVLVEQGKSVDGYTVEDIDEDEVTLVSDSGGAEVVLAAPVWRHQTAKEPAVVAPKKAEPLPEDPYGADVGVVRAVEAPAAVVNTPALPADPKIHVAEAPGATPKPAAQPPAAIRVTAAPGTDPAAVAAMTAAVGAPADAPAVKADAPKPDANADAAKPPAEPAPIPAPSTTDSNASSIWSAPTPAPAPATATPAPAATAPTPAVAAATAPAADAPIVLARADVATALAHFGTLATSIRGAFTAGGAHIDQVAPTSLFFAAGLRDGDTITAVDGRPLRSLDDAAALYARADAVKSLSLAVTRAGKPLTLHVLVQ